MSDGNNADNNGEQHRNPARQQSSNTVGVRSASPAKRSAADMEGHSQHVPGSFVKDLEAPSHFDEVMKGNNANTIDRPVDEVMETQDTTPDSTAHSDQATMTTNTSATSVTSTLPPPYSLNDTQKTAQRGNDVPSLDEQVQTVSRLMNNQKLEEGERGYVVSTKWLSRVLARSSEGLHQSKYPKEAREGDIGPVDNLDIVPDGAFVEPILKDSSGQSFIPIKRNLSLEEDYYLLPYEAWGLVVGWYGNTLHQKPIVRYVHDTAPQDASYPNFIYELEPPVITIRKIPQPHDDDKEEHDTLVTSKSSAAKLAQRDEQRARGQLSPSDAIQLVSSKSERFNDFLKRAKEAAGIPRAHKVKIWKLTQSAESLDQDAQPNSGLSLPGTAARSSGGTHRPRSPLVLDLETWNKMDGGKDFEPIAAKDETNNNNYNGKSSMSVYELYENATIVLEEMIGGPGGGEFPSDAKKHGSRLAPTKRILGSKPGSAAPSGRTSPAPPSGGMLTRGRARRDGRTRGTVGLTNLGNTCYMNSALQCIRSVEELALFFLSGKYKSQINADNPLGHKGAMAKRYAELLESIYADTATGAINPTSFRKTLGSIQPMFSGYGQQDSQEFLSFLVDALHEDLNRIHKKPYNENPDSDDKTVHDPEAIIKLGEVYRANHRARNDSVAMDLFSGFYKNTMECPVCDKISITFDPYSLLTVQLPIENTFQHDVAFVPLRGTPVNHSIDIDRNASVKMLKEYIASQHPSVKANRLWMAEVYSHKIYKVFDDSITFGEAGIQPADHIFMFELDAVPTNPPTASEKKHQFSLSSSRADVVPDMDDAKADHFVVPVFSRQKHRNGSSWENIFHPMYITVTREQAQDYEVILKKILIAVSRLTSKPILTELQDNAEADQASSATMKDESAGEDIAQITEHSASSEDGYVEVSLDKSEGSLKKNGNAEISSEDHTRPIPQDFMDPQYLLSPQLRNNLFVVNYGSSEAGGLHCTGMSSVGSNLRPMSDRVKPTVRRSSVQSSSSDEDSTTSTGSGVQANGGETDESDVDNFDKPDMVLGGDPQESFLGMPPAFNDGSDDELPDDPLMMSRKGRRKNNKHDNKKNGKLKTYSKKGQRGHRQKDSLGSMNSTQSHGRPGVKSLQDSNDSPYFIKLGEGIVLDWYPQAMDILFGGDGDNSEDDRGHFVSSDDGKNLPVAHDAELEAKKDRRETRKKHGITLDDCFLETGKRETLSEDNAWYCNRCKELRRARKTLEIWTIPDILVVHLKRFGGNRSFRDKIDVFVDYPIEGLDMTERVGLKENGKEYIYDLFAVDNHYGGLGGGHYTALAKNFYDGQWYDYNDSNCSKVTVDNSTRNRLHSAAAYLLFYRRRSEQPLGAPELQELVLEARNPQIQPDEAGEESDSGEGKLGGPTYSLRGSPSGLEGAGVDPVNLRNGGSGSAGLGARASNNLTTKTNLHHEQAIGVNDNGAPIYGPRKPSASSQFGNQGASWDFNNLDGHSEAAQPAAETLITNIDDGNQDDDDKSSTHAMFGTSGGDDSMDEDFNDVDDTLPSYGHAGPTPTGSDDELHDQHGLYLSSRAEDSLILEDAGTTGEEMMEDGLPTVDIYPDAAIPELEHDKMD